MQPGGGLRRQEATLDGLSDFIESSSSYHWRTNTSGAHEVFRAHSRGTCFQVSKKDISITYLVYSVLDSLAIRFDKSFMLIESGFPRLLCFAEVHCSMATAYLLMCLRICTSDSNTGYQLREEEISDAV